MTELALVLIIVGIVLTVLWIVLPFLIMGLNKRADTIIRGLSSIDSKLSKIIKNQNEENSEK